MNDFLKLFNCREISDTKKNINGLQIHSSACNVAVRAVLYMPAPVM